MWSLHKCYIRRLVALALTALFQANAFYLPGVAPRQYMTGDLVEMKVNTLTSVKTQLPFGYYTLPYCKPDKIKKRAENLGEILGGDLIKNAPYELKMYVNESCKVLCQVDLGKREKNLFRRRIDREYKVNWIVDNLPAATKYVRQVGDKQEFVYLNGFPVGLLGREGAKRGHYYILNHVRITLSFHQNKVDYQGFRIVGFEVDPRSMNQQVADQGQGVFSASCISGQPPGPAPYEEPPEPDQESYEDEPADYGSDGDDLDGDEQDGDEQDGDEQDGPPRRAVGVNDQFDLDEHAKIWYTYDVVWVESEVRWASRWDKYLQMEGGEIHWLSILNSVMIVVFLSGLLALILLRTLHRDIAKYNELATTEEIKDESGWKLVHGDVFRKPNYSRILAACLGCGTQLLGMAVVTLMFAALGFLSPAHRGGLLQSTLLLFTFMGVPGGYVSARFYKFWQEEGWKEATLLTALLFPGSAFVIFFFLNLLIWGQASAGSVPFATMFALLVLWFGISVPLVFLGAYLGYRKEAMEVPVRTNQMPREIPLQPWYMKPIWTSMMGGMLPFGAVFTELFFIMSSIWQHNVYYMFGFLALVLVILVVTCAEISIAMTYFQLTAEDYHWWWRSFASAGFSGAYVFLYSLLYFWTKLQIDKLVSVALYFGYMFMMSVVFTLVTGTIGMVSSFYFNVKIFGSIKVD